MPANFEDAFARVKELAADFKANEKFFLSPQYQEAEARRDFIDKFLIALGWDVNHDTQKNPYEQEVKVERKEHGVSQRRADYAFYIAPNFRDVKFYMEAKKPFGDIATSDNYFQTIRYGWGSQTPIAALIDFEQFEIVDCRFKPDLETALQRNLKKFHYSQFSEAEEFAEIYWLFSREAVAGGSLEKYAETLPKKHGAVHRGGFKGAYQSFDEAFLEELDGHRKTLAHSFKNGNPKLDGETLTEVTQRTLDRLVFIRFLEDKLIEPQYLVATFGERGSAWGDFITTSRRLDGIYNGIVFKKHDILDSPAFKVDDHQFGGICEALCHINSPYDFNVIPIHILGSIYERFLGKVIVATEKRARVEEKPEVRKAGGVYYTPEYIVRYIVENTVGTLIQGKTPPQIAEMRFADIACGSGSFLLGVYDLLIRYYTKFYNDNPGNPKKGDVVEREDGLHLSLQKKRDILLNNIYGVDIDTQAVEVAQLSLYLKLLQDETPSSAREYQMEFHETLLPSLNKNIVCGNSLIGRDVVAADFFENGETEKKLNPMDFEHAFSEIMKHGGFDAIVSNPPWGAEFKEVEKQYFRREYAKVHVRTPESFNYFVFRMWRYIREQGLVRTIIPSSFLNQYEFWKTRKLLVESARISRVCNLGDGVFQKVTAPTCIVIFGRQKIKKPSYYIDLRLVEREQLKAVCFREMGARDASAIGRDSDSFILQLRDGLTIINKCNKWPKLKEVAEEVATGISSGLDSAYVYTKENAKRLRLEKELLRKLVVGGEIHRFLITPDSGKAILYLTPETDINCYPRTLEVLLPYREQLKKRREAANGKIPWFSLNWPRRQKLFVQEKILIRQTSEHILAAFDTERWFCLKSAIIIQLPDETRGSYKYILALLNSRLMNFIYQDLVGEQARVFPEVKPVQLFRLPIRSIDFSNTTDRLNHERMVSLVEQMLAAKKQLACAQSDKDKNFYERKCAEMDRQIDALVYGLYGLTAGEIKIVEEAAA